MTQQKSAGSRMAGPSGWQNAALRVVSPRKAALPSGALSVVALVLRVATAGLLVWIGWIHWHLWSEGYKFIATNGPFFLGDVIVAVVLAVALLAWPRALAGLVTAGFLAGTIGALVISLTVGLFGFQESIQASFVVESLWLESIALVLVVAWTALVAFAGRREP
jgi:hypothetical protein